MAKKYLINLWNGDFFCCCRPDQKPSILPINFSGDNESESGKAVLCKNINMHKHEPKVAGGAFNPAELFAFFRQIDYAN